MPLVDYPDSDEEDVAASPKSSETPSELPPLPKGFHDLYASTTRVSTRDDPSLHGGRKRITPHVEGNWPTHIYIEWFPSTSEHAILSKLVSRLDEANPSECKEIYSFLTSDLGTPLPLHVSLSRPISFSTEVKDAFFTTLESAIRSSKIQPFDLLISDLTWVQNFEGTRWFLVLKVRTSDKGSLENELNNLLHVSNTAVQKYGQPPLYTQPVGGKRASRSKIEDKSDAFHISIAWTLEKQDDDLLQTVEAELADIKKDITVEVNEVKVKIGNVITSVPLGKGKSGMIAEGSLFGF